MVTQCCICTKTKTVNGWEYLNEKGGQKISHGFCPDCYQKQMIALSNSLIWRSHFNKEIQS